MRRLASAIILMLAGFAAMAANPAIRDIDINVSLSSDGSADITEVWDVCVTSGTEWYLVKDDLGRITVSGLSVTDETGRSYKNEGDWDIDRSISEKAGRCGLVRKRNGCEICWGVGSYGDHVFTVRYKMDGVIDGYSDYDAFHLQLVSPGLSAVPEHVKVKISADTPLNNINSRLWGFGFYGTAAFEDGAIMMESSESFKRNSSVITLLRFNKGLFSPASTSDSSFDTVLEKALDGASYQDDEEPYKEPTFWDKLVSFLTVFIFAGGWIGLPIVTLVLTRRRNRKKILGCKLRDVSWCRDIPFDGDILLADYVLGKLGVDKQKNTIASAMILRMIKNGYLTVGKDSKDRVELSFNANADSSKLLQCEKELYDMMQEASGSDHILQHNEFSKWSAKHTSRVTRWVNSVKSEENAAMGASGYQKSGRFTDAGQSQARKVVGFKLYLQDFTIINERQSVEVQLWHDYLVFAALYGIADKVAKELKDINPQAFDQMMVYDYTTMNDVVRMSRVLADSITNVNTQQAVGNMPDIGSSRGGFGGYTSFGGGGGFHGGGFGGGSR